MASPTCGGVVSEQQRKQARTWLTVSEMAQYCEVSQATVRRWIKRGELAGSRLAGGHYRVRIADFVEFLGRHNFPIKQELVESESEKEGKDASYGN
jgi:excisionase family DNA binding protein